MIDFFEFSNEMLCLADQQGYFTRVNPAWTRTLGWSAKELTSRPYIEFVHPDDLIATLNEARLLQSGHYETIWFENRYRCLDGTYRWLAWRCTVVEKTQIICSARDITEQKRQTAALRLAEERFRAYMDNSPTIVWAKDETGRIVYLNRTAEERFRFRSRDEWFGKTDFDIWPAETARRIQDNDQRVLRTGQAIKLVEITPSGDGEDVHWMTMLFPYHDTSERRFVGGIAFDVTDIKRAEAALIAEQDLLRSLIEVQENEKRHLCHEFHDGLIQYAVGAKMLLEGRLRGEPSEADRGVMKAAVESLEKGIEDGRRAIRGIRPAVLDDSTLEAALDDLIDHMRTADILIKITYVTPVGVLPKMVQTALYRVVQEALNNARKYSGTDVVRIRLERKPQEVVVEIRDFGCGFEVAKARGRGFGLLGMTERVRLLGGDCTIESTVGEGTRITARLPPAIGSD